MIRPPDLQAHSRNFGNQKHHQLIPGFEPTVTFATKTITIYLCFSFCQAFSSATAKFRARVCLDLDYFRAGDQVMDTPPVLPEDEQHVHERIQRDKTHDAVGDQAHQDVGPKTTVLSGGILDDSNAHDLLAD